MPTYRVYRTDATGKIRAGEWLDAPSDEAARTLAMEFCEPGTPAIELWQGGRLVCRLDCRSAASKRNSGAG